MALGVGVWLWLLISLGYAFCYGVLTQAAPRLAELTAVALIVAWVGVGVFAAITDGQVLVYSYVIPIAVWLTIGLFLRSLGLREARDVALALAGVARSAPYVAPVVLVAVLLPALTEDVWQLAAEVKSDNLIAAAVLSVGLLLLFLARQLRRELEPALAARCRALGSRPEAAELTRAALIGVVDQDSRKIISELPAETLREAWPADGEEYAPYLAAAEGHTLRRPLRARLLITAAVVGTLLAGYIYALLAVTVPRTVASEWSRSDVQRLDICLLGVDLALPGGPYVAMALLLGVFATAIFLAFALTEERIAAAMTEALLRQPLDRFLVLALPFVSLLDWALEYQPQPEGQSGDEPPSAGSDASGSGEVSK